MKLGWNRITVGWDSEIRSREIRRWDSESSNRVFLRPGGRPTTPKQTMASISEREVIVIEDDDDVVCEEPGQVREEVS